MQLKKDALVENLKLVKLSIVHKDAEVEPDEESLNFHCWHVAPKYQLCVAATAQPSEVSASKHRHTCG